MGGWVPLKPGLTETETDGSIYQKTGKRTIEERWENRRKYRNMSLCAVYPLLHATWHSFHPYLLFQDADTFLSPFRLRTLIYELLNILNSHTYRLKSRELTPLQVERR